MPVPDFVLDLRRRVGHDLLWLPATTAVVLDDDRVLLARRADDGSWGPVSGIIEPGEHPARAAVREVLEETGVTCVVEVLAWVGVTQPVHYANGDRSQYVDHTFRCRYVDGTPRVADDESLEVGWFHLANLPVMPPVALERIITAAHHSGPARLD